MATIFLQKKSSTELGQMELPWSDATKPPEGVAMVPVSQDPKMTRGVTPAKWHCIGSDSTKPPSDSVASGRSSGIALVRTRPSQQMTYWLFKSRSEGITIIKT